MNIQHTLHNHWLVGCTSECRVCSDGMVWYGIVNVDLYSAIITKVSNALSLCWLHVFCRQLAEKYSMEIPRSQVRSTADTH